MDGKVIFSGTESENGHGHMEGAVISGKRAADDVMAVIKKTCERT